MFAGGGGRGRQALSGRVARWLRGWSQALELTRGTGPWAASSSRQRRTDTLGRQGGAGVVDTWSARESGKKKNKHGKQKNEWEYCDTNHLEYSCMEPKGWYFLVCTRERKMCKKIQVWMRAGLQKHKIYRRLQRWELIKLVHNLWWNNTVLTWEPYTYCRPWKQFFIPIFKHINHCLQMSSWWIHRASYYVRLIYYKENA